MHGIRDTSPSADLLLRPEAGCIGPAKSFRANRGGLGDDQSSRSTLRVVLCLQGRGHVIMRSRTHPGEWRHNDAVRKIEVSHSIWCKKRLIRHHMNSCIDRLHLLIEITSITSGTASHECHFVCQLGHKSPWFPDTNHP